MLGIIIIVLLTILIALLVYQTNKKLAIIFIIGVSLRYLLCFLQEYYSLLPYVWDEEVFYTMSVRMKEYFLNYRQTLPFESLVSSVSSYGMFGGIILAYLSDLPVILRLVNGFIGGLIILSVYRFSILMGLKENYSNYISMLIAFTPSYIIFSSLIMRDMIVWLLIILAVMFMVKSLKYNSMSNFIYSLLISLLLIPFRKQYVPILAIILMFFLLLFINKYKITIKNIELLGIKKIVILVVFAISSISIFYLVQNEISSWGKDLFLDYFNSQLGWRQQGGASYLSNMTYTSISDIIMYSPIRFIYFTFGPFLGSSTSPFILLTALEALVGTISFIYIMINLGIIKNLSQNSKYNLIFIIFFAIIGLSLNAIIDSNFGTAIRHRMVYMQFIFIASLYLYQTRKYETS
jgi:hypothetical protein